MKRVAVGIIGCGYWGPNLVRTFVEIGGASVRAVADRDRARLDRVAARYPQLRMLTEDYHDLFDARLDAVIVCTPPETHYDIVRACLERGLDVLVEKPLATSSVHARELVDLAERNGRVLMVGHIGAYTPAITELRSMMSLGALGDIAYIDAVRVGLGLFRANLNVVWDLAPHDIAILMYLLGEAPNSVSARGLGCVDPSNEDVAYLTLSFPSGVLAHVRLSWLDPCKTRRVTVVGKQKMVVYDDLENLEKLKIYDKHVDAVRQTDTFGAFQFAYHYGSVLSPYIEGDEPLRLECLHFLECVRERSTPLTDGRNGLAVVEVIEAAQQSLHKDGRRVPVAPVVEARSPQRWRPAFRTVRVDAKRVPEERPLAERGPAERGSAGAPKPRKAHRKAVRRAERAAFNANANGNGKANGKVSGNGNGNGNGNGKVSGNGNGKVSGNGNGKAAKAVAEVHEPVHEEV
ncbi:MAG TPA: Gfo/Idh/MocA family oxidoreductase [Acidimicrobiia bacterium]